MGARLSSSTVLLIVGVAATLLVLPMAPLACSENQCTENATRCASPTEWQRCDDFGSGDVPGFFSASGTAWAPPLPCSGNLFCIEGSEGVQCVPALSTVPQCAADGPACGDSGVCDAGYSTCADTSVASGDTGADTATADDAAVDDAMTAAAAARDAAPEE